MAKTSIRRQPHRDEPGGESGSRVGGRFLATWISGIYIVLFTVWVVWGGGSGRQRTVLSDVASLPGGLFAACFALLAARDRQVPARARRGWKVIAIALACFGVGDVVWFVFEVLLDQAPFPSVADALYLAFYPMLLGGLVLVSPPLATEARARVLIDALTVTLGASVAVWVVAGESAGEHGQPLLTRLLTAAYPVGDVLIAFGIIMLLLRHPPRSTAVMLRVLMMGAIAFICADLLYARLSVTDSYAGGDLPDALWMLALWLFVVAAQQQRVGALEPEGPARGRDELRVNPLPYLALVAGFLFLLYRIRNEGASYIALWLVAFTMASLVCGRQLLAIRDNTRLANELQRYQRVVESSQDAIFSVRLDGAATSWNQEAERMFGFGAEEVAGRDVSTLIVHPGRRTEYERLMQEALHGYPVRGVHADWTSKGGAGVPVSVSISPIHDATAVVVGASFIARDISAQQRLARELETALGRAETALAETRATEESTRQFLADAAHQLRTPIAGLRACVEALLRGAPPDRQDDLLGSIGQEAARAGRLVGNLLTMARLDHGRTLRSTPTSLSRLCQEEAVRLQDRTGRDVVVDLSPAAAGHLDLDADAVREILANLLDNASRNARTRIEVAVRQGPDRFEVWVRDDGDGIEPGLVPSVFERFVSLDGRGGSGLGLAIARGHARAHGGDLLYEDGAFVLWFPADRRAEPTEPEPTEPERAEPAEPTEPERTEPGEPEASRPSSPTHH